MRSAEKDHATRYLELFMDLPLAKLLEGYHDIELRVIEDLTATVGSLLRRNGFVRHGSHFTKRDRHYRIVADFLRNGRALLISLHGLHGSKNTGSRTIQQVAVEHFGLIREIALDLPSPLPFDPAAALHALRQQAVAAYTALEQSVASGVESLQQEVFAKLYSCLEFQLKLTNKKDLFGRFWLFIAEPDVGFYFFDRRTIEKAIAHYKLHQDETMSPLELTAWIMTAPLPFQKSLAIEAWRVKRPLSLAWSKARYIADAERIFMAETSLYRSEKYSAMTICEARGYYLVAACPAEISADVFPEIEARKRTLVKYFTAGIRQWSPYVKTVKRLSTAMDESTVASLVGTVLGKTAAEFLKGLGSG